MILIRVLAVFACLIVLTIAVQVSGLWGIEFERTAATMVPLALAVGFSTMAVRERVFGRPGRRMIMYGLLAAIALLAFAWSDASVPHPVF